MNKSALRCAAVTTILAVSGLCLGLPAAAVTVTFTNATAISAGNLAYEGYDVVVAPCTVTIDGAHAFNSLTIRSNGIVTHPACTATSVYSLALTLAGSLAIDAGGKIDVVGKGYLPNRTVGNSTNNAATGWSGGSHGGLGYSYSGISGAAYDEYRNPLYPGAGGGGTSAGGGVIRIQAAQATVNGLINANGSLQGSYGSGAGGSIRLDVGTLSGGGLISANGGNAAGNSGAGGGGRVAVYHTTCAMSSTQITAYAGHEAGLHQGAAGTVYYQSSGQPGELRIFNDGLPVGMYTPLGVTNDTSFVAEKLMVSGTGVVVQTDHQMPIRIGTLVLTNWAQLTHAAATAGAEYSLDLTVSNALLIAWNGAIDVVGKGYLPNRTVGNSTNNAATGWSGGSHGGLGYSYSGISGAAYDEYRNPLYPGAGGGGTSAGGGVIRIQAAQATVNGLINANGSLQGSYGSGAGGSIRLDVGTLSGGGLISANGGNAAGNSGAGGGGRVAVYHTTCAMSSTQITAYAGHEAGLHQGAAGTVYYQSSGQPGELRIFNDGLPVGMYTPLGVTNDTSFVAEKLMVSGTGVVVQTDHQMPIRVGSLVLTNGAQLTHPAATAGAEYGLDLTASNVLVVALNSSIDVIGKGYLPGRTIGNTTTNAATGWSGGSHGGLGYAYNGVCGIAFDDYRDPASPGAGSSGTSAGGGVIRIQAPQVVVSGRIIANGACVGSFGGGAGGSIRLDVGALSGNGLISANGGHAAGNSGGGGGGRIALYYTTCAMSSTQITAYAGHEVGLHQGAAGTVYYQSSGQPGELRIFNDGLPVGMYTPLGVPGAEAFTANRLFVSGSGVVVQAEHQMPIQVADLVLTNQAVLTHPDATVSAAYYVDLVVSNRLVLSADSRIDALGKGYLAGRTKGNSTVNAATGWSGGSHGGLGFSYNGTSGAAYDDYRNPLYPGAGGAGTSAGGGVIRIQAQQALVHGQISANGSVQGSYGAGAGGAIRMDVGTLSGSGWITANGGNATGNSGAGGGGRIALYYTVNTMSPTQVTVYAGNEGGAHVGAAGTIYLKPAAGRSELRVVGDGLATAMYTPLGAEGDDGFTADLLTLSGSNVMAAPAANFPVRMQDLVLGPGTVLAHRPTTALAVYSLNLQVSNALAIATGARLDVTGRGYLVGRTFGNVTEGASSGYSGGSHGGRGFSYYGTSAATYGDRYYPVYPGSGGAGSGPGGGVACVRALLVTNDGVIAANGGTGVGAGGGGGGSLILDVGRLAGSGRVTVNGGNDPSGGGGGGGRLAIYYWDAITSPTTNCTANPGQMNTWAAGQTGTVWISGSPFFTWILENPLLHGVESLQWDSLGLNPTAGVVVTCSAFVDGMEYAIAQAQPGGGALTWDTANVPDGQYELRATFAAADGSLLGAAATNVLVNNSVIWHSGTITGAEVWASGTVHVVEGHFTIASNAVITVAAGAVVKFSPDVQFTIAKGGTLIANGVAGGQIFFTSLNDDSVGGDTNMDADRSRPQPGDWRGFIVQTGGTFTYNDQAIMRYLRMDHSGTVAANESWLGTALHQVTGNLTLNAGVSVTILPGAVVKVATNCGITAQAGAALFAHGTVAQPIIFTSENDDSAAGDSNRNGDATRPGAGDWNWILFNSATGSFDHCRFYYGGGPAAGGWGPAGGPGKATIKTAGASVLDFNNSLVRDSFYDGLLCWGGPVTVRSSVFKGIDRAICAHPGSPVTVRNCTLDNNGVGLLIHGGSLDVANTLVANSIRQGILHDYSTDALTIRYSCLWNLTNAEGTAYWNVGTNGNISVDPKFKSPTNDSYQLNFGSPCIDAADGLLAPATDYMDAPRYTDPRSPHTGIACTNGEYADIGAFEFVENADSDLDLVVDRVDGPAQLVAGTTATVTWVLGNIGAGTVNGAWHDEVALIPDTPTRDVSKVVAANVLVSAIVGPGGKQTVTAAVRVPGGTEGTWRWQVTANAQAEVFEGRNWRNNASPLAAASQLQIPELAAGVPVAGDFAGAGLASWYKFSQPAGADYLMLLDAATSNGRCRVYAGFNAMPTDQNFDQRSIEWNSADARMGVPAPGIARTVYLLVMPETLPDGRAGYTLQVGPSQFDLSRIDLAGAGNAGDATAPLRGSGFAADLAVSLQAANGATNLAARRVLREDSTRALATFALLGAPTGLYHVVAQQGGLTAVLSNAFAVAAGRGGAFKASLIMPAAVRVGRPFSAMVEFANQGDADVPIPLLMIESAAGYPVWLGDLNTEDTATVLQFPAMPPSGLSGGVLAPGARHSVEFYSKLTAGGSASYSVTWINGDNADVQAWDDVRDGMQPAHADALWSNAWTLLTAEIGPTVGDYIAALAQAAEEIRGYGYDYLSSSLLMWFMMEKAMLEYPGASLAGTLCLDTTNAPLRQKTLTLTGATGDVYSVMSWHNGAYAFRDLPAGTYTMTVPGYLPNPMGTLVLPAALRMNIMAHLGARIAGLVQATADSAAISNAQVVASALAGGARYIAATDDSGRYALDALEAGDYFVSCSAADYVPSDVLTVTAATGTVTTLSFSLASGGTARGQVLSPWLGPATNATVSFMSGTNGSTLAKSVQTDTGGWYRARGLAAGLWTVIATAPLEGSGQLTGVSVAERATTDVAAIQLGFAAGLTGRVTSAATGLPLAGARVGVDSPMSVLAPNIANSQGFYAFAGVTPGSQTVWCAADGYFQELRSVNLPTGGVVGASFALRQAGRVAGTLRAGDGSLMPFMSITLSTTNGTLVMTNTDANGQFDFSGLPDATFVLSIGGVNGFMVGRQTFNLNAATNQYLSLTIQPAGALLKGRVWLAGGVTPAATARVDVVRNGQSWGSTFTDSQGRYAFYALQTGRVDITAWLPSGGVALRPGVDIPATGSRTGLDCTAASGVLRVSCVNAVGSLAVTNGRLVLQPGAAFPADYRLLAALNSAGQATFSNLVQTSATLWVTAPGFSGIATNLVVGAGGPPRTLTLAAGASLSGYVRDATGKGLGAAMVTLTHAGTRQSFGAKTSADGAFLLDALTPGTYEAWFFDSVRCPARLTNVVVRAGLTTWQDATLAASGATLYGRVGSGAGTPAGGARVTALDAAGFAIFTTMADSAGQYVLTRLPDAITVNVAADGMAAAQQVVSFGGGGSATQNFALATATVLALDPESGGLRFARGAPTQPSGFSDWWNSTSDFWTSLPRPWRNNLYPDTPEWRNSYLSIRPVNANCLAYLNAMAAANFTLRHVDEDFATWELSYEALKELNKSNMKLLAARMTGLAAKLAAFAVTLESAGPVLASYSVVAGEAEIVAVAGMTIGLVANSVQNTINAINDKDFSAAEAFIMTMGDLLSGMADTVAFGGSPYAGTLWLVISAGKDVVDTYGDIKEGLRDNMNGIQGYNNAKYLYWNAVGAHDYNMQKVRAAAQQDCPNCKDSCIPCPPRITPPPPPPPPNPCCGKPQPCPPPCRGCPPGGGGGGGTTGSGSWDPNDKLTIGYGSAGYIADGTRLLYTIRFENRTNATAPAQMVVVTDGLSTNLDWSTLELGAVGFNNVDVGVPAGLQSFVTNNIAVATDPYPVRVTAAFDQDSGLLSWTIESVDPVSGGVPADPLAGFLPPNDTNHVGEGYVSFSIRPRSNLVSGASMMNWARIVFDQNAAIDTPMVTNILDIAAPTSTVERLPEKSRSVFTVSWSGSDNGGSGIVAYDVYVRKDQDAYTLRWTGSATSGIFTGEVDSTYAFYSIATDGVGYRQVERRQAGGEIDPDTITTIQELTPLPWLMLLLE